MFLPEHSCTFPLSLPSPQPATLHAPPHTHLPPPPPGSPLTPTSARLGALGRLRKKLPFVQRKLRLRTAQAHVGRAASSLSDLQTFGLDGQSHDAFSQERTLVSRRAGRALTSVGRAPFRPQLKEEGITWPETWEAHGCPSSGTLGPEAPVMSSGLAHPLLALPASSGRLRFSLM